MSRKKLVITIPGSFLATLSSLCGELDWSAAAGGMWDFCAFDSPLYLAGAPGLFNDDPTKLVCTTELEWVKPFFLAPLGGSIRKPDPLSSVGSYLWLEVLGLVCPCHVYVSQISEMKITLIIISCHSSLKIPSKKHLPGRWILVLALPWHLLNPFSQNQHHVLLHFQLFSWNKKKTAFIATSQ